MVNNRFRNKMETKELSLNDLKLHHPFNMLVAGASQSGKSEWVIKLLKNYKEIIDKTIKHVLYCFGIYDPKVAEIAKIEGVKTHFGIPSEDLLKTLPASLVIFDDLLLEAKSDLIDMLFTRGTHHHPEGLSLVFVTQDIFTKSLRTARINSAYYILLKNRAGERQIRDLGINLFPRKGDFAYFYETYLKATEQNWGYLLIDCHSASPEIIRLRTNIFPLEKGPLIIFTRKS